MCFNAIVFSLDDVLYNAVSKPLFELLQKWFHWNRFQLISSCLLGESIVCGVIGLLALASNVFGSPSAPNTVMGLIYIAATAANFARYAAVKGDLKACSDTFESGGYPKPSTRMVMYRIRMARRDEIPALFFVLSAILWLCSLFDGGSMGLLFLLVLWITALFNRHLWRSSDIDPKDRMTLLSAKKTAASSASS